MNEDDDLIARTLTERPLSAEDEAAISRVQSAAAHHDFAAQRHSGLAIEFLLAGVVAVVVVTFILAVTRPANPMLSTTHTPVATADDWPADKSWITVGPLAVADETTNTELLFATSARGSVTG